MLVKNDARVRRARLAVICAALGSAPACAQDALYGRQPPPGSAFLRFVNARSAAVTVRSDFAAEAQLGTQPGDRVGPYTVAPGRLLAITAEDGAAHGALSYPAAPDSFVTIVLEPGAGGVIHLVPIIDRAEFNQMRARLAFYNLAPGCASGQLALSPGGPVVFQAVAADATQSRSVNPVEVTVRATCAGQAGPSVTLHGMVVGGSYSLWLMQPGADATLLFTPDVSARYVPPG